MTLASREEVISLACLFFSNSFNTLVLTPKSFSHFSSKSSSINFLSTFGQEDKKTLSSSSISGV